jgi:hypothetical protein
VVSPTRGTPRVITLAGCALAGILTLAILLPFARAWRAAQQRIRDADPVLARAHYIADDRPKFRNAVALIDHVRAASGGRAVLVVASAQMIYFLIAKPSPLEKDEFLFSLVAADAIALADVRAAVDERRMVARIAALRPLVVDEDGPARDRMRAVFPELAAYLDREYRAVARFGSYMVLDARAGRAG